MEIQLIYKDLLNLFKKVDFEKLWPRFKRYPFALYDGVHVYMEDEVIPWDYRFMGNTSIKYQDQFIAIWDMRTLSENYDVRKLCAKLTHEMFHAHQLELNETKYPNEIIGMDYPFIKENFVLKHIEGQYLIEAYLEPNYENKMDYLKQFKACRLQRENLIGDVISYEYGLESFEGVAVFVEYKALKQLTNDPHLFNEYLTIEDQIKPSILKVRQSSYLPSMLLVLIYNDLNPSWKNQFIEGKQHVWELVNELIPSEDYDIPLLDGDLDKVECFIKGRDLEFQQIKESVLTDEECKTLEGNFEVVGLDPMNVMKKEDLIIHHHMLNLKIDRDIRSFKGPLVAKHDSTFLFRVKEINYLTELK